MFFAFVWKRHACVVAVFVETQDQLSNLSQSLSFLIALEC